MPKHQDRPPLKIAVAIVIGKETMNASQVLEGLQERGWAPNASNPRAFIAYLLSSAQLFERQRRGYYRVNPRWRGYEVVTRPRVSAWKRLGTAFC